MGVAASLARVGAELIALLHARAELATVEVEEEVLRYFTFLVLALTALFFMALSVILTVFLLVILFWEDQRIAVLIGTILFLAGCGIYIGMHIRERFRRKPQLLGNTLMELSRDIDALKPSH